MNQEHSLPYAGTVSLFPKHGYMGVLIIVFAELCLVLKVKIVGVYFTPIAWTGYILFLDGILWRKQRFSLFVSGTKNVLILLSWSVVCWLIFEGYNIYLKNWQYVGLPENISGRLIGYVWSFATIFPAILLTARLFRSSVRMPNPKFSFNISNALLVTYFGIGVVFITVPLAVSQDMAVKLFAFVWVGFIFLLDPINYWRKQESIIHQLSLGNVGVLASLLLSGISCGVLWEFWNYWSTAKWVYNVPLSIAGPKMFEMPLLGYLGFLPFAVECYVMNEFLYSLFPKLAPQTDGGLARKTRIV